MKEELLNLDSLTEEERQRILEVLKRNEELQSAQDSRISEIKSEINAIRMNAVLKQGEDGSKFCSRCREAFGFFFNTGEICPQCKCKVCKKCREYTLKGDWICILCYKQRQLKALTGEWLTPVSVEDEDNDNIKMSAPDLVRESISDEDGQDNVTNNRTIYSSPTNEDMDSSSEGSGVHDVSFPREPDKEKLSTLLTKVGKQPSPTNSNKSVQVVHAKHHRDSDSESCCSEPAVVDDVRPVSPQRNNVVTASFCSSHSALSTGRNSQASDTEDGSYHADGNGAGLARSRHSQQPLAFDDSSYRAHSDLPDVDDLIAKSKARIERSPLSSMTSSPTPSSMGQRLLDLANSAENSDADDLQNIDDLEQDFQDEHQDYSDEEFSEEDITDEEGYWEKDSETTPAIYALEYSEAEDASDILSVISEDTEPSQDEGSDIDFEKMYKRAKAEEESVNGEAATSDTEIDSIIEEMSEASLPKPAVTEFDFEEIEALEGKELSGDGDIIGDGDMENGGSESDSGSTVVGISIGGIEAGRLQDLSDEDLHPVPVSDQDSEEDPAGLQEVLEKSSISATVSGHGEVDQPPKNSSQTLNISKKDAADSKAHIGDHIQPISFDDEMSFFCAPITSQGFYSSRESSPEREKQHVIRPASVAKVNSMPKRKDFGGPEKTRTDTLETAPPQTAESSVSDTPKPKTKGAHGQKSAKVEVKESSTKLLHSNESWMLEPATVNLVSVKAVPEREEPPHQDMSAESKKPDPSPVIIQENSIQSQSVTDVKANPPSLDNITVVTEDLKQIQNSCGGNSLKEAKVSSNELAELSVEEEKLIQRLLLDLDVDLDDLAEETHSNVDTPVETHGHTDMTEKTQRSADLSVNSQSSPDLSVNTQSSTDLSVNAQSSPDLSVNTQRSADPSVNTQRSADLSVNTHSSVDLPDDIQSSLDQSEDTHCSVDQADATDSSIDMAEKTDSSIDVAEKSDSSVDMAEKTDSSIDMDEKKNSSVSLTETKNGKSEHAKHIEQESVKNLYGNGRSNHHGMQSVEECSHLILNSSHREQAEEDSLDNLENCIVPNSGEQEISTGNSHSLAEGTQDDLLSQIGQFVQAESVNTTGVLQERNVDVYSASEARVLLESRTLEDRKIFHGMQEVESVRCKQPDNVNLNKQEKGEDSMHKEEQKTMSPEPSDFQKQNVEEELDRTRGHKTEKKTVSEKVQVETGVVTSTKVLGHVDVEETLGVEDKQHICEAPKVLSVEALVSSKSTEMKDSQPSVVIGDKDSHKTRMSEKTKEARQELSEETTAGGFEQDSLAVRKGMHESVETSKARSEELKNQEVNRKDSVTSESEVSQSDGITARNSPDSAAGSEKFSEQSTPEGRAVESTTPEELLSATEVLETQSDKEDTIPKSFKSTTKLQNNEEGTSTHSSEPVTVLSRSVQGNAPKSDTSSVDEDAENKVEVEVGLRVAPADVSQVSETKSDLVDEQSPQVSFESDLSSINGSLKKDLADSESEQSVLGKITPVKKPRSHKGKKTKDRRVTFQDEGPSEIFTSTPQPRPRNRKLGKVDTDEEVKINTESAPVSEGAKPHEEKSPGGRDDIADRSVQSEKSSEAVRKKPPRKSGKKTKKKVDINQNVKFVVPEDVLTPDTLVRKRSQLKNTSWGKDLLGSPRDRMQRSLVETEAVSSVKPLEESQPVTSGVTEETCVETVSFPHATRRATPLALNLEPSYSSPVCCITPSSVGCGSPSMLDTPALDALSEKYSSDVFTGQFYQISYGLDSPGLSSPSPTSSTTSSEIAPSHQVGTESGTAPNPPTGTADSLLTPMAAEPGSLSHFDSDCSEDSSDHSAHSGLDLGTEHNDELESSLVASDHTDVSSVQDDSGNITATSQGSSPVPSIHVLSPEGDEVDGKEAEVVEPEPQHKPPGSTFHQTFGSLFSSLGGSRESIASYYSQAGGGTYGVVKVKGSIQFAVDYKHKIGSLEISVKQCTEIAAVDEKRQRSDPYVKTYLLPDRTRTGKRKTGIRKNTLEPVFNETLRYNLTKSELSNRTLWLSVWHHDRLGHNVFLGEVTLPLTYYTFSSAPQWYQLQDREEMEPSMMTYKGDLVISLKYIPLENLKDSPEEKQKKRKSKEGQLCVLIKEAKNLTAVRANGYSDSFCKGYLLPNKSVKQKTTVVKKNLSPKWSYLFTFEDVAFEDLPDRSLELTVWDYDRFSSNDFLGGLRLNIGTGRSKGKDVDWMDGRGEEISIWQSMIDKPNTWVDGTLTLRPNMDKVE